MQKSCVCQRTDAPLVTAYNSIQHKFIRISLAAHRSK